MIYIYIYIYIHIVLFMFIAVVLLLCMLLLWLLCYLHVLFCLFSAGRDTGYDVQGALQYFHLQPVWRQSATVHLLFTLPTTLYYAYCTILLY